MKCWQRPRAQSRAFSRVRRLWSKVLKGSLLARLAWATAAKCTTTWGWMPSITRTKAW